MSLRETDDLVVLAAEARGHQALETRSRRIRRRRSAARRSGSGRRRSAVRAPRRASCRARRRGSCRPARRRAACAAMSRLPARSRTASTASSSEPLNSPSRALADLGIARLPERVLANAAVFVGAHDAPGRAPRCPGTRSAAARRVQNVKVWSRPAGSKRAGIAASAAKMAFTSLAKYSRPSCSQKYSGRTPSRSRDKHQATGRLRPRARSPTGR